MSDNIFSITEEEKMDHKTPIFLGLSRKLSEVGHFVVKCWVALMI